MGQLNSENTSKVCRTRAPHPPQPHDLAQDYAAIALPNSLNLCGDKSCVGCTRASIAFALQFGDLSQYDAQGRQYINTHRQAILLHLRRFPCGGTVSAVSSLHCIEWEKFTRVGGTPT